MNVPRVLAWVFGAISNFLSKETVEKFVVLGDARELSRWIEVGELPERYGGSRKLESRGSGVDEGQMQGTGVQEVTSKVERMDLNGEKPVA